MSIILGTAEHQKALVTPGSHPITLERGRVIPRPQAELKVAAPVSALPLRRLTAEIPARTDPQRERL